MRRRTLEAAIKMDVGRMQYNVGGSAQWCFHVKGNAFGFEEKWRELLTNLASLILPWKFYDIRKLMK
jgi:hypothetical protein